MFSPWNGTKTAGGWLAWAKSAVCHCERSSSSLSAGMSVWDRKPKASKADGVGRQKFNSLDGGPKGCRMTSGEPIRVEEPMTRVASGTAGLLVFEGCGRLPDHQIGREDLKPNRFGVLK